MKEFEIHAFISYVSGGTRYHDCYVEYVTAKNETEAKKMEQNTQEKSGANG